MNGMTIAGLDVVVIGGMLLRDYKAIGMTSPGIALAIVMAGVLIAILGGCVCHPDESQTASKASGRG